MADPKATRKGPSHAWDVVVLLTIPVSGYVTLHGHWPDSRWPWFMGFVTALMVAAWLRVLRFWRRK